jgi:hypothetical protein
MGKEEGGSPGVTLWLERERVEDEERKNGLIDGLIDGLNLNLNFGDLRRRIFSSLIPRPTPNNNIDHSPKWSRSCRGASVIRSSSSSSSSS